MKFIIFAAVVFFSVIGMSSVLNLNEYLQPQFITVDYFAYAENIIPLETYSVPLYDPLEKIQNSSYKIPSWIKDNARWWADDLISDSDFIKGIQFMIKEGIIIIPTTLSDSNSNSNKIPSWIKDHARWWAEGSIDDASFVRGVQFMIQDGMLILHIEDNDKTLNNIIYEEDWFSNVKEKLNSTLKQIQDDPFLDSIVQNTVSEIPVVGGLLVDMYNNSKDSPEDKIPQILELLQNYERMNEEQLREEFKKLEENKGEILNNRNYLKQLISDTSRILEATDDLKVGQEEILDQIGILEKNIILKQPIGEITRYSVGSTDSIIPFSAIGSYDPDGEIVNYEWDFGDGFMGNGNYVTHTYDKSGKYRVTLIVTDDDDLSSTKFLDVEIKHGFDKDIPITLSTDKPVYDTTKGKVHVKISGEVSNSRLPIMLKILNPDNGIIVEQPIKPSSNGNYEHTHTLKRDAQQGQYIITAKYDDGRIIDSAVFYVATISSQSIIIPEGTSGKGCIMDLNGCYIPDRVSIYSSDVITWINKDKTEHTVTSGSPESGPDAKFDSDLILPGDKFTFSFEDYDFGVYQYYCTIHPWQTGTIEIQEGQKYS